MVDPRMRVTGAGLRDLENPVNVYGLGNMDLNRPEEETLMEGNPIRVTSPMTFDLKYLRRYRRIRLDHELVDGFINNYCFILQDEENFLRCGRRQRRVMGQMLERQFLPWIRGHLVYHLDESQWPLRMFLFWALDGHLLDRFPKIHSGACWQAIAQCYLYLQQAKRWMEEEH